MSTGPACDVPDLDERMPPPHLVGRALADWRASERHRVRRAWLMHEVEWLLDGGTRPDLIPAKVGYTSLASLITYLDHWDRRDLSHRLAPTTWDHTIRERINAANRRRRTRP